VLLPSVEVEAAARNEGLTVDYADRMQRQRCKVCWNADGFDFHVPGEVWRRVVPEPLQNHVVCLRCFNDFARERSFDYSGYLDTLYFAGDQVALVLKVVSSASGSRR
jgi:hypothetical protein